MYIADLHIHSSYSRATGKGITPEVLELWGRKKGISLIGTGDFTHPAWRRELSEKLVPAEEGFYRLKEEFRLEPGKYRKEEPPRFAVTGEISSIYKQGERVRKVHSLIILPSLEDAQRISLKLETIGNIHSDGRPILGLSCRDLLEITLELCPRAIYIPAHIWTPHFSLFGAFSGFDTVEECFGDLSGHIHAMETGLSSDPIMNRRLSMLDKYQLVSNSDAHSPAKLGREATVFSGEFSYDGLYNAVQYGNGLHGTIEFYPEEGKYHLDGHRKCGLRLTPSQTKGYGGVCPVCGRKITVGVLHRVEELADRDESSARHLALKKPFESLMPLNEVIAASCGKSTESFKVKECYEDMLLKLGSEFSILREVPAEDIRKAAGGSVAEGIKRLREGRVFLKAGYDGEYGRVKLFSEDEMNNAEGQMSLSFGAEDNASLGSESDKGISSGENINRDKDEDKESYKNKAAGKSGEENSSTNNNTAGDCAENGADGRKEIKKNPVLPDGKTPLKQKIVLNERQRLAVENIGRVTAVSAGPGTGKTGTLTAAVVYRISERGIKPSEITALTFTNKAAEEMRERLKAELKTKARFIRVGTIHSICLELLKKAGKPFEIADEFVTKEIAAEAVERFGAELEIRDFLREISLIKNEVKSLKEGEGSAGDISPVTREAFNYYTERLKSEGLFDFDDILTNTRELLKTSEGKKLKGKSFSYIFADEFQDTGRLEYELIKELFEGGKELFAIGDSDQSIYGFRGADASCFDRLSRDFPELKLIRLAENFRSERDIVEASCALISNNPGGKREMKAASCKEREGLSGKEKPVKIIKADSELSSAIFIAKEINKKVGGIDMADRDMGGAEDNRERARSFSDIAVLYRSNYQAALIEKCLRKEGIPYVVSGKEDFLLEDEVRGCVLFFRYVLFDDEKAKKAAFILLSKAASKRGKAFSGGKPQEGFSENEIKKLVMESLKEKYLSLSEKKKPGEVLEEFCGDIGLSKDENTDKMIRSAVFYKDIRAFIESLSLGRESDVYRVGGKGYSEDRVSLMTVHASKGLEFPTVFIFGAEEGKMPKRQALKKRPEQQKEAASGIEAREDIISEERRIFFVAMTRAKEELYINTVSGRESRFIAELPSGNISEEKARAFTKSDRERTAENVQLNLFDFMK